MTRTVLFLGGSPQQLAPLEYAKRAGYRVVVCDNQPQNPGHRLADASYDVSTLDIPGVLGVARKEHVNAVVCYATDVAVSTAASVAEELSLPGNPLRGARILTDKGKFRKFQVEHGYFAPMFMTLSFEDLANPDAVKDSVLHGLGLPVVVKPVDASGAKGVSKVHDPEQLAPALLHAVQFSRSGFVIVEQLITPLGYQICGEGFLQDGRIAFHALFNEHFCPDLVVPIGETFPCVFNGPLIDAAIATLQTIFDDLGMLRGPFNFDLMLTQAGEIFVIEIGPRNGGNRIPEAIRWSTGVDTIAATVENALGHAFSLERKSNRFCATYSIHAKQAGILRSIEYAPDLQRRIIDEKLFAKPGDAVERFTMGSLMLGNLILGFDAYAEMLSTIERMDDHIRIHLEQTEVYM